MAIISYADAYKKHLEEQKNAEKKDIGLTRKYSLESGSDPGADIILGTLFMNPAKIARGVASATGKETSEGAKKALGWASMPGAKIEQGFFGAAEGITDFLAGGATQLVGQKDAAKWIYDHSWSRDAVGADVTDEYVGDAAESKGYRLASDLISGVGNVGFQIAVGTLIGGALAAPVANGAISQAGARAISFAPLFASASGAGTAENIAKTGELGWRENVGGLLKGGVEVLTEVVSPTGKIVDRAINGKSAGSIFRYLSKHAVAKNIIVDFASEAGEEMASYAGGWFIENKLKISDEAFSARDMVYQGVLGGITGAIFAAPSDISLVRSARSAGAKVYAQGDAAVKNKINEGLIEVGALKERGLNNDNVKLAEAALAKLTTDENLSQTTKEYYLGLAEQMVLKQNLSDQYTALAKELVAKAKADPATAQSMADAFNALVNEAGGEGKYTAADFTNENSEAARIYVVAQMANDWLSRSDAEIATDEIMQRKAALYQGTKEQKNAIRSMEDGSTVAFRVKSNAYAVVTKRAGTDTYSVGFTTPSQVERDGAVYATHNLSADKVEELLSKPMTEQQIDAGIVENLAKKAQAEVEKEQKAEKKPVAKTEETQKKKAETENKGKKKTPAEAKKAGEKASLSPAATESAQTEQTTQQAQTETKKVAPEDLSTVEKRMTSAFGIDGSEFTKEEWTKARECVPNIDGLTRREQARVLTLVRTAQANGINEDYMKGLARLSSVYGFGVVFEDIDVAGFYSRKNGMVVINPNNLDETFGHEIEHSFDQIVKEGKAEFRTDLSEKVKRIVGASVFDRAKAQYKADYEKLRARDGSVPELSDAELDAEATANVVGKYLSNMTLLKRIAATDYSLGRGLLASIRRMKGKWTSAKAFAKENDSTAFAEYRKMNRIERMLIKELADARSQKRTAQGSVSYSPKSYSENLSTLATKKAEYQTVFTDLKAKREDLKNYADVEKYNNAISEAIQSKDKAKIDKAIAEYTAWSEKSGYGKATASVEDLDKKAKAIRSEISQLEKDLSEQLRERTYTDAEKREAVAKAVRKFHTTQSLNRAGYLTTTGFMLDFSEGQRYRVQDHREISEVLNLPDFAEQSDGMIAFMNMGNIRLQTYGIDIATLPNAKQISALRGIIRTVMQEEGEFVVDFSLKNGDSDGSVTYPQGTSTERIITDIKTYFENGQLPNEPSEVARYHAGVSYSPAVVSKETDAKFEELAKEPKKNDSALREMVKQAAKAAGFDSPLLYHGTGAFGFTTFDLSKMDDRRTIFLTDSEEIASTYSGSKGIRGVSGKANIPDNVDAVYIATELNNNLPAQEQDNGYYYIAYSRKALSNLEKQNRIDLAKLKLFLKEKGYEYGEESSWSHKFAATIGQLTVELNKPYNSKKNNLSTPIYILANNTDLFGGFDVKINGNYGLESRIRLAMRLSEFFSNNAETNTVRDSVVAKVGMDGYDVEVYSYDDARALLEENSGRGNYGLYANLDNTIEINGDGRNWNTLLYQADVSRFYEPIQGAHGYRIYNTFTNETFYLADTESGEFATKEEAQKRIDGMVNGYKYRIARLKTTREVSRWAQAMGYSGVVLRNITDNGGQNISVKMGEKANIFMFFDPASLKSADPVTYDDFGNIIPLSERFNPQNDDIRYSPAPSGSGRIVIQASQSRPTGREKLTNLKGELSRSNFRAALESLQVIAVNAQQGVENQLVRAGLTKREAGAFSQLARSGRSHAINAICYKLADMTGAIRSEGLIPILEPFLATKGEVYPAVDKDGNTVQSTAKGGELAGKRYSEFSDYYAMLHAIDREAVGKNPYSSMTVAQMKQIVAEYEQKNPDFKAAAEKLSAFNSAMLDIEVQAGIISQETADLWRKQYPHYVPMYTQDSNAVGGKPVRGSRNMEVRRDNAAATESDHRVSDPLRNYIDQVQRRIRAAKLNILLNEVYNSADGVNSETVDGKTVWSVRYLEAGKDGKEHFVELTGFKTRKAAQLEYLKHQGNRINDRVIRGDVDAVEAKDLRKREQAYLENPESENDPAEMFRKFKRGKNTVNEVSFYKDGKRVTMAVTDRIYTGLSDLGGIHSSILDSWTVKAVKKVNDTFKKLVTNWNPFFAVKNIARDLQDGTLQSRFGMGEFLNMYRKNAEMMATGKYNDMWEEFLANGGLESSLYSDEFGTFTKGGKSGLEQATGIVGQFQHIKNFNTLTEALPRFTEYCLTRKHGGSVQTALLNAADVTVNFGRSGTLIRILNSTVSPFLNPAVQGLDRVIRLFTEDGIKNNKALASLLLKAVLLAIVPMALGNAMYGDDDEYKDMQDNIKENNYLFKVGNTWLKIPRGRFVSTISGMFNRSYKELMGEDVDWKGYAKNVLEQITPAQNVARHIGSPFYDVANNRTWYGTKIESDALQNYAVNQRYDENTSRISVWIGQMTSHFGLSPKEVNYLIDQYTGVVGDILLPTTTPAGTKGVVSYNFTVDPNTSSNLSNRFYDLYNKTMYKSNDGDAEAYYLKKRLDETKSAVSELFKQIKTINASSELSNKEKVKQASAIRASINQLYKTAIDDRRLYEQNIKDALAIENSYAVEKITAQSAKRYGLDSDAVGKYALTFGGDFVKQYDTEAQANDYKADAAKKTVYAEANRLTYGAEYALREYNVNVYDKAKTLNELGISYDEYYNYYMTARYYSGKTKKDKILAYLNASGLSKSQIALMMYYSGYTAYADEAKKAIKASSLSAERKKELLAGLTN